MTYTQNWDGVTPPAIPSDWTVDSVFTTSTAPGGLTPISSPNLLKMTPVSTNIIYFSTYNAGTDGQGGNGTFSAYFNPFTAVGSHCRFGITARGSATPLNITSTTFYRALLNIDAGTAVVQKIVSGSITALSSLAITGTAMGSATWYQVFFTLNGTSLQAQFFRGDTNQWLNSSGTWQSAQATAITVTDSSITGAGYFGLTVEQNSTGTNAVYSDNYSVTAVAVSPTLLRFPPPAYPLFEALGFWPATKAVNFEPRLPWPTRTNVPARTVPGAPLVDYGLAPQPYVTTMRLADIGTPVLVHIAPPGPMRSVVGVVENPPPHVWVPPGLPSVGSPTLSFLSPPGLPGYTFADAPSARSWSSLPTLTPSHGTPSSTGPGLLVPPTMIVKSWFAGGTLGGGGLAGQTPGYGNFTFNAPPGNGSLGNLYTGESYGAGLAAWTNHGLASAVPSGSGGSPTGGGIFALGQVGCCCGSTICFRGCSPPLPIYGILVQLISGGSVVDSCTTGTTGCCNFTESGTYTVKAYLEGVEVYNQTVNLSGTIMVVLPDSDLVCCGGYLIPTSLKLTDSNGTFTILNVPGSMPPTWTGGRNVTMNSTPVSPSCVSGAASSGPVAVGYQLICNGDGTFTSGRSWSGACVTTGCGPGGPWNYYQTTSAVTAGQDLSSLANIAAIYPPTGCPNADNGTGGSATPSSSTPFAIRFSSLSSFGVLADPIGGSWTISA